MRTATQSPTDEQAIRDVLKRFYDGIVPHSRLSQGRAKRWSARRISRGRKFFTVSLQDAFREAGVRDVGPAAGKLGFWVW